MQFSKVFLATAIAASALVATDAHLGNVHCTGSEGNVGVEDWATSSSLRRRCNLDRNNEQYCLVIDAAGLDRDDFGDCSSCSSSQCRSVRDELENLAESDDESESEDESDDEDEQGPCRTNSGQEFAGTTIATYRDSQFGTRRKDDSAERCQGFSGCTHYNFIQDRRCYLKRIRGTPSVRSRSRARGYAARCD
eukprot:Awhi_evm1s13824